MRLFKALTAVVLLMALLSAPRIARAGTQITLSLDECVEIALSQNTTVRVADMEISRMDYSRRETLGALLPRIDYSLNYQRSIELQTVRMDLGGESQKFKMGSDNTWNTGFSASLPLLAPTLWKSLALSDTQILAARESARASRLETVNEVRKAYYGLLLALDSRRVIADNIEVARLNADLYRKRFEQGTASEYDVLRSQVQVSNLEPELLQADIAVSQWKLQLCVLLSLELDTDISPDTDLESMQAMMRPVGRDDISLDGNSSLRDLDLRRRMASQTVDMKRLDFLPTLGASFNVNWMALSNGSPFRNQEFSPYSTLGFSLSLPLFTGGTRLNSLRQAKVQQKELDLQRENLVDALDMQVRLAIDNLDREARQISSSRLGVDQAVKANDIMQKSFEIGAATYLELRDSELAETSARLVYLQSIHSWLVSAAELDLLIGAEPVIGATQQAE